MTLLTADGTIAGYAYWFQWSGQAYDAPRPGGGYDSIYPDIRVLVQDSNGEASVVAFAAAELLPGASKSTVAGRFSFTVTIRTAEQMTYSGTTYVWAASLSAVLTVTSR